MYKRIFYVLALTATILCSCKKDPVPASIYLTVTANSSLSFNCENPVDQKLTFKTNGKWTINVPEAASWLTVSPTSGDPGGSIKIFSVSVKAEPNNTGKSRSTELEIVYGTRTKKIPVSQSLLHQCSDPTVTKDMLFSTTLGRNNTNVCQGFDYDPDEDMVYITQKYGVWRNHIGWQKRETGNSTTVASNFMTLGCFCHGNNIAIEKKDGKKYVWAPNYGTRQSDGSYDRPRIVSRFPLVSGQTIYNTETTENYYFGQEVSWPAFDFEHDMMAICTYKMFYVYKLSELMALPDEYVTVEPAITYGGSSPVDTKIAEFSGKPVVKAKNCTKVKPLYTVTFDYSKRGLHWQSYCIYNGWIYAILEADTKSAPEIMFDTYVEAYKMDGSRNVYKIRQEYMQNRDSIVGFDWNESDYFYCEPEGIKVMGDTMLMLYCMRGKDGGSHVTRRPVIFKLATPIL